MNARRLKFMSMDPEDVGRLFAFNRTLKIESKLPLDAKCVSVDKDIHNNRLLFMYESKEFDLVKEGEMTPELPWNTVMIIDEGD